MLLLVLISRQPRRGPQKLREKVRASLPQYRVHDDEQHGSIDQWTALQLHTLAEITVC